MAQPKKLTPQQKKEKKLLTQIAEYKADLMRLKLGIKQKFDDMETWRWAALEIFKELTNIKEKHLELDRAKELALKIAREAQMGINFAT